MEKLESELLDLAEDLLRNDDIANKSIYNTIYGAANDVADLERENDKLRELLADCHALLQRCCDTEDEHGENCPLWPDHGDDCNLRKVERRMRDLWIEV